MLRVRYIHRSSRSSQARRFAVADVREILELRMCIGGEWVEARAGESFETVSPATGEVLAVLPQAGREDVRAAIEAAGRVRKKVAATPVFERAELCERVAEVIDKRREVLARELSLEQGKPYREAVDEVAFAAELFRDAAENVKRLETGIIPSRDPGKRILTVRQPHGVVGIITPWNYPVGIPSEYLSAALASGNTVVWKPAPTTSLIAVRLTECLLDGGVPEGAVNLVFGGGEVGEELVSNPGTHAVGFTGSSAVGSLVAKSAGAKPMLLELGGNGPPIILDDADLDLAIEGTAFGCFSNAGQICQSSERILVQPKVHDAVLEGLVRKAESIRLGHPLDEETTMGPLNNEGVAAKTDEHLDDARERGAVVVSGGGRAGAFPTLLYYSPTVIDRVPVDSLFNREETFGPVAPVISVRDVDEALEVANACPLGLCGSVYTSSLRKAFSCAERLECGVVNVNETAAYWDGRTPFGGYSGKVSGVGRLGGMATIHSLTQVKSIVLDVEHVRD
jgi:succinate-semialdehyde dehydrogenase/glutarate-semialdehyde dehydrogenase